MTLNRSKNYMQIEITEQEKCYYNVLGIYKPHKRTILWNGDRIQVNFNFDLIFSGYLFGCDNIFYKTDYTLVGALINGKVHPFPFPHVCPTNMKFCNYSVEIGTLLASPQELIEKEANVFFSATNEFYMNDNFSINYDFIKFQKIEPLNFGIDLQKIKSYKSKMYYKDINKYNLNKGIIDYILENKMSDTYGLLLNVLFSRKDDLIIHILNINNKFDIDDVDGLARSIRHWYSKDMRQDVYDLISAYSESFKELIDQVLLKLNNERFKYGLKE